MALLNCGLTSSLTLAAFGAAVIPGYLWWALTLWVTAFSMLEHCARINYDGAPKG
jgi:hypothetical protein